VADHTIYASVKRMLQIRTILGTVGRRFESYRPDHFLPNYA